MDRKCALVRVDFDEVPLRLKNAAGVELVDLGTGEFMVNDRGDHIFVHMWEKRCYVAGFLARGVHRTHGLSWGTDFILTQSSDERRGCFDRQHTVKCEG